jgi:AraC family ethanolamine operon transcriptional activator
MLNTRHVSVGHFDDPDDHARALRQLNQQYLQTGPGRFAGLLQQFSLDDGVHLYRERLNVPLLQEGALPSGRRMFGISRSLQGSTTVQGRKVGRAIAHLHGGQGFMAQTTGASEYLGILIDDRTFEDYADYLGGMASLSWRTQPLLEVNRAALRRASASIWRCVGTIEGNMDALDNADVRKALRDDVIDQLICLLIDVEPRRRNDLTRLTYTEIVSRSRQQLLADPAQPVSVLDLCKSVRVSRGTLQSSFLEVTGATPAAYLRAVRLSRVRRLLRQTSTASLSVHDAASRWGFIHMGKFAADYCRMFGHLPSRTVRP